MFAIVKPFFSGLFLITLLACSLASPVRAETPIILTDEIKARLIAAKPLNATPVRDRFNGKPVLVTFFASW